MKRVDSDEMRFVDHIGKIGAALMSFIALLTAILGVVGSDTATSQLTSWVVCVLLVVVGIGATCLGVVIARSPKRPFRGKRTEAGVVLTVAGLLSIAFGFFLRPGVAVLSGRVVDVDGNSVDRVNLEMRILDESIKVPDILKSKPVRTDKNGEFRVISPFTSNRFVRFHLRAIKDAYRSRDLEFELELIGERKLEDILIQKVNEPLVPVIKPAWPKRQDYDSTFPAELPGKELFQELFYSKANSRLATAVNDLLVGEEDQRRVTFVMGPAGIGKSTVLSAISEELREAQIPFVKIKLEQTFPEAEEPVEMRSFPIEQGGVRPKLSFGQARFVKNVSQFGTLQKLLELSNQRDGGTRAIQPGCVVLIDDLDEIHPQSSDSLLRTLGVSALKDSRVRHVFFFGRTEAFREHLTSSKRHYASRTIRLNPHRFASATELVSAIENIYKYADNPKDYDVKYIVSLAEEHPFIWEMIHTLKGLAMIVDVSRVWKGKDLNHYQMKTDLFDLLLSRNKGTHGRPDSNSLEYNLALTKIARMYAEEASINGGYFKVRESENVRFPSIEGNGSEGERRFLVQEVLSYSGLVEIKPGDSDVQTYRFLPTWVHPFLVERYIRENNRASIPGGV